MCPSVSLIIQHYQYYQYDMSIDRMPWYCYIINEIVAMVMLYDQRAGYVKWACRSRIYNRHGLFDTNRLRLIIYTPLLAN